MVPMCNLNSNWQALFSDIRGPQLYCETGSYFADDSILLARSPTHVVQIYKAAMLYCKGPGAGMPAHNCKTFTISPRYLHSTQLANNIEILALHTPITILGVPMSIAIDRKAQVQGIIQRLIQRRAEWENQGRTLQSRVIIRSSKILSITWYLLSGLPTNSAETQRVQNVADSFIQRMKCITWGHKPTRGNIKRSCIHSEKKQGCLSIPTIATMLTTRKQP